MALVIKKSVTLIKSSLQILDEIADPRSFQLPIVNSVIHTGLLICIYLLFVLKIGPALMKDLQPLKIDRLLQAYNLFQVVASGIIFVLGTSVYYPWGEYSIICQAASFEDTPFNQFVHKLLYAYFLIKILDWLDTIFFVLRKKNKQISFLHVYHHVLMVTIVWMAIRYFPGGQAVYVGVINSFVHCIMYGYYFLTSYDKQFTQNIWWKKYITLLQMFQFLSIFIHALFGLVFNCGFPKVVILILVPQVLFIFVLFADFYRKNYTKKAAVHSK